MTIIETCPASSSRFLTASPDGASAACVADPLHAIVGSWLGVVVQPTLSPAGPAPTPSSVVRCDDARWG